MPSTFELFSLPHLFIISLAFLIPIFLSSLVKKKPSLEKGINYSLTFLLIANKLFFLTLIYFHDNLQLKNSLPLQAFDIVTITAIITLFTRSQWCYEVTYFWGLASTLHCVIIPMIIFNFPDPYFISFFISHLGILWTCIYLTLALKIRPQRKSVWRAYILLLLYGALAGTLNHFFQTNYAYLYHKPFTYSLLDYLGRWPYYIGSLTLLALVSFCLCYLPFFLADLYAKKKRPLAPPPSHID